MNIRSGKTVAKCTDDTGLRRVRLSAHAYDSLNQAKRANGLNSQTAERLPQTVDEAHAKALDPEEPPL
jgi:hypothetical protein